MVHPPSTNEPMTNYLLCCDWGTSSFRLQLLDVDSYRCIGELTAPAGVAGTFADWKKTGEPKGVVKDHFFRQQLNRQIQTLARQLSINLTGIPVAVSGMASSSIGMDEIPYATLPFPLDGSQSGIRQYEPRPGFPHEIMLISGVRSGEDVMRGEETQLIGLIALLQLSGYDFDKAIFIFPGTHSKHLYVRENQLIDFATYMTGELFYLMGHQSILKDSIELSSLVDFSPVNVEAFRLGVRQARVSGILHGLFTTRTNQLFDTLTKAENTFYLSGLLIGSELHGLLADKTWPLILCSGSTLSAFYTLAIDELNLTERTVAKPAELIDQAASVGQVILYRNQAVSQPTA